jgi:Leucine-rich repeat (LRR) protein
MVIKEAKEEKERNGEKSHRFFTNIDILDESRELEAIKHNIEIEEVDTENTSRQHENYNSLWPISSPVKRSTEREKAKLSCPWHPKNYSLACELMNSWQEIKNEINEKGFNNIKISKVNFASISSRHQKESTKTLSLNCGLPSKDVLYEKTKEDKTEYVQLFGSVGSIKDYYNYYDGDIRRRKNASNKKKKRNSVHIWPQLTNIKIINCPLITSSTTTTTAAVKKQLATNTFVHKKSILTSLFQSIFGSVSVPIMTFTNTIRHLDLSNNGIHNSRLFTNNSFGNNNNNNKRSSRKLLSLECKAFGSNLETLNLSENEFSSINQIFNSDEGDYSSCPKSTFVNLHELRLNKNRITRLTRDDLSFAPYLERLYLSGNEIQSIHDAFYVRKQLKVIDLSNNQIPSLPTDFFTYGLNKRRNETLKLTEIHLQNNSLREIPNYLFQTSRSRGVIILPHLVLLNLSRNAIVWNESSFNKQLSPFEGLPNLVALDLSYNQITRYAITFQCLILIVFLIFKFIFYQKKFV